MAKLLFSFIVLLPFLVLMGVSGQNETFQVKVGVVVDVETPMAKVWLSCLDMALSEFYASKPHFKTRLLLKIRDSNQYVVDAASAGFISISLFLSLLIISFLISSPTICFSLNH